MQWLQQNFKNISNSQQNKITSSFYHLSQPLTYITTLLQIHTKTMPIKEIQSVIDSSSIQSVFQEQFHTQLFFSRCQDTGQKPDRQKAKVFKQSLGKINSKKQPQVLNLYSMRLGVNTIMKLISVLQKNKFTSINLADNSISQYGMHAIKSLISSSKFQSLNLASNMISQDGLSLILQEMIKNPYIKSLDLGILQGSIRKNSFGIDGARCLAAILLQNKRIEVLKLEDNDIGINGAQIISIPLKRNRTVKELKISENLIKTQGAQYLLNNAIYLVSLDIGKNFIKSSIGPTLKKYLTVNTNLKKLNLQLNQLRGQGANILFQGLLNENCSLQQLNLKGNAIGNNGIHMIYKTIQTAQPIERLKVLDLSCNELNDQCIDFLIGLMDNLHLLSLNIARNNFGDDGMISFVKQLKDTNTGVTLEKFDISSTKLSQKAFIYLLENINFFENIRHLKCTDNYISEKFQKAFISLLQKNQTLIFLSIQGNRLSLAGMKGMKRIIDRNMKKYEDKQPSRMKSEIYNLRQKQKKIKQAQQKIQIKKRQLNNLEDTKNKLAETLNRLQAEQKNFRQQNEQLVRRKLHELEEVQAQGKNKEEQLKLTKEEKEKKVESMEGELKKLRDKRKALQYQLTVTENQGQMIEKQFQRKIKQVN